MTGAGQMEHDDALDLSRDEATALARRLVANHLHGDTEWLQWEDVPLLSERAFFFVEEAVDQMSKDAIAAANACDRAEDIDSIQLLDQARG